MTQDIREWLANPKVEYHTKQFEQPYRSTVLFCDWLQRLGLLSPDTPSHLVDLGCGMGANLFYLSQRYPRHHFTGIDINPDLVQLGNLHLHKNLVTNAQLTQGDLYRLDVDHYQKYSGLLSFQTLSWLPDYETALVKMMELGATWIGLTSLFYEGDVNCTIKVQDYSTPIGAMLYRESFYNIYSLKLVEAVFKLGGYTTFLYTPFEIDIDLPKPVSPGMGTYTETLQDGRRWQISGPLLLPWYFVAAYKEHPHP